ncbi:MAG: DUF3822 family protein [Sphingobacteriales bacterium]|nr:MAG: DUF3822 family protein [Sphingobacteriales bacterium]
MDNKIYICDGKFNTDNSLNYQLLVEIGANYYSYAVVDADAKLKAISYNSVSIFAILDDEPVLKLSFKSTIISLNTQNFTFIPTALYNQNQQLAYTQFLNNAQANTLYSHTLLDGQITALHNYNTDQLNAIKKVFKEAKIIPQYLPFIESTFKQFNAILGVQLFLNVQLNHIELLILHNGELKFYNVFECFNNDEMLYYTMLACKKNDIQPQNVTLRVCGKIGLDTDAYQQLNCIFTDIRLTKTTAIYVNSAEFETVEAHKYFSLLSLIICE